MQTEIGTFQHVQETSDTFLALFAHRYDFIYALHPNLKEKPDWYSENRYPLSDRQILEGKYLYGVRFERETAYCLLDIDRYSSYHPQHSPLVLERMFAALEPLGITQHIVCTSSDSDGLHIYLPLAKSFNSWKLAKAVSTALANAGFKLKPGQLELFPNPKSYSRDKAPSLFNAHRLPLQMGSYVLNDELWPISNSQSCFVRMWRCCQQNNHLDVRYVNKLLKSVRQYSHQLSHKSHKFLGDLDTEIELGWTGHGQTNRLLGRIAMRAYVFHHAVSGEPSLSGDALSQQIVAVAKALPGYRDWCRHQHEIEDRASEWASCVENSRYFPYGTARGKYRAAKSGDDNAPEKVSWNDQRAQETQAKITQAVQALKQQGVFPEKATARFRMLLNHNIGGASLYRYRELWHPIDFELEPEISELQNTAIKGVCTEGAPALNNPTSLLLENGSNPLHSKVLLDHSGSIEADQDSNIMESSDSVVAIRNRIKQQLAQTQKARAQVADSPREVNKAVHRQALQRMREFLLSGEPILLIEVGQWLLYQPQGIRDKLIANRDENLQILLTDLSAIAQHLVPMQWSSLEVRSQLEICYGKSTILELTASERLSWQAVLWEMARSQDPNSQGTPA
ncbi:MAG: hypothetical protein WBA76_06870 [Phormidesmis sp.]